MNYPDGDKTQVMRNEAGKRANLQGRANGAVIKVIVDHSEGSLAFRVDGKLSPQPMTVRGTGPEGVVAGQAIKFKTPKDGRMITANVPPGVVAGMPFNVAVPPLLDGFPKGAPLRPWASVYLMDDRIRFEHGYHDVV